LPIHDFRRSKLTAKPTFRADSIGLRVSIFQFPVSNFGLQSIVNQQYSHFTALWMRVVEAALSRHPIRGLPIVD
jgi:hypothetical protein